MDKYLWKAIYNDGTFLRQIDPDGTKHAYQDIDRTKLSQFEIWPSQNPTEAALVIPFEPNQKLIWRRRTATAPGPTNDVTVHLVGKQETVDGQNRQVVFALFESDGHVEVSDRWDDTHPWFFPVKIHPHEGEEE